MVDLSKVLSLLEACFDLISGSSLSIKIQIMDGKSGVQIPALAYLYPKMVSNKDMQFFMENLKMKRKNGQK